MSPNQIRGIEFDTIIITRASKSDLELYFYLVTKIEQKRDYARMQQKLCNTSS